jgi:putative CocE/NonD family hydrolase
MWSPMQLSEALERVNVPVLLVAGWQDLFVNQTFQQYERLSARGLDVALTVGPWTHVQVATKGAAAMLRETLDWLNEHVAGTGTRTRLKPVRVFVTGAAEWRDLDHWPPPTTERTLHPQPGGGLGDQPAPAGSTAGFTYDPADPTPTVGGPLLLKGGYRDDRALAERRDVLSFTGPALTAPVEVLGRPVIELAHTSDNPHADLFVRISEVDAKGRSHNISDGFLRLDPATAGATVRIVLDPIAHRFRAGTRIRLLIAGGSHPRWERNLGTGDDPATSTRLSPSLRTIDLAGSRVTLPVGP